MTIDFPPNPSSPGAPTPGQIFTDPGGAGSWQWDGVKWSVYSGPAGASVTVSDTAPSSPNNGNLWFNSSPGVGQLFIYYADPNTSQWVITCNLGGGQYLPLSGGTTTGPITHQNAGVLIGNAGSPPGQGGLVLNANAAAPAAAGVANLRVLAADNGYTIAALESYGSGASIFATRQGGGTAAAPAAVGNGYGLGAYAGYGYDGTGFGEGGRLAFQTTQAWTGAAHGSQLTVFAIPNGSTTDKFIAGLSADTGCQFQGTTGNDNPPAGWVGEFLSAVTSSAVSMPINGTATNIISLALTPGDWDITGFAAIGSSGNLGTNFAFGVSPLSNTLPVTYTQLQMPGMNNFSGAIPPLRVTLASAATYYLIGYCQASSGTAQASGEIFARRRR